ncbi:MAG TPA: ABC transporter permease [Candidatus Paceibacterota bacterium]|nr:ABC transporter permease [Verrucomicrobiota bacterium]HOX03146.1 ABC transporter permease [Verrucomicrobiota bacterium]HRZ45870.1 ABC transporter permease [Candidatus Paceibacterota bacterium]HRZ93768.1 ABC transporter permease [Candidatus Paceibacterota bacterium]
MNRILCIARREYLATVRTKGFVIGLLIMPLLMFGTVLVIHLFKGHRDVRDRRIAVVDRTGRLAPALAEAAARRNAEEIFDRRTGRKLAPAYWIEVAAPAGTNLAAQRLALSDRVRRKELHAYLEIGSQVVHPRPGNPESRISYHSPGAALDEARGWLSGPINQELRRARLTEAGITEAQVPHLFSRLEIELMSLVSADARTGEIKEAERRDERHAVIAPMVLAMLVYVMVLMAALPMLHAVMEEKTQRIAEILLGAARPFELMFGKMLSALAVALTGSAVYLTLGILLGYRLDFFRWIPWSVLPWLLLFLPPAILMYAALSAAMGSACNDPKDAQNLTFPVIIPAVLPLMFLMPVIQEPQSMLSVTLSLIPPFTPILMMVRLGLPNGAPWWQGVVGWVGLVLFALLMIWMAGRIFRAALLIQGNSPRGRDLARWLLGSAR